MFGLQPIHIAIIVVLAVLLFGPKKLPEFGKSLGKSIREFKQASKEMSEDFKSAVGEESSASAPKATETPAAAPARPASPSQPAPSPEVAQEHAQS